MPPDAGFPGSPAEWMRFAKADLAMARAPLPEGGLYELLCFHAQQAVEKSIKAVLINRGIPFTKTHIIERLVDLLPEDDVRVPELAEAAKLSVYATVSRYPADSTEPVSEEEYRQALALADAVVLWSESVLPRIDASADDEDDGSTTF